MENACRHFAFHALGCGAGLFPKYNVKVEMDMMHPQKQQTTQRASHVNQTIMKVGA
jgi:hypothetical protein